MKKVVIINQDSGYLMIDIANAISVKHISTILIAGRLVARKIPLSKSIKIKKIIKYHRGNKFLGVVSWVVGFIQISFLIKTKYRKDYLFIVSNPPIVTFLPLFCRNEFSLMIYDIFPDTLTHMGLMSENFFLVRLWREANRIIFPRASSIITLSENMASNLKNQSANKNISIIPIWSDSDFFYPIPKEKNPFIDKFNLRNKFVVLYSGNLGVTHNVEIIPELASSVLDPDIIFVIIGEGNRRKWIDIEIRKRGLKNCLLLPLQPVENMCYSFASADIAMVTLGATASELSLPSKTFNFMSAGLPLLCIAKADSELNKLVTKYNNGRCFAPDELDKIVSFINNVAHDEDLHEQYKSNSSKASLYFTPRNAEMIADLLYGSFENN